MDSTTISTIQAMAEVGFTVICAGLVIFYVVIANKRQNKREEERDKMLTSVVQSVLNQAIHKNEYNQEVDKTAENISNRVYEVIQNLREKSEGSRVSYIAYHNGTRDLVGSHFSQMSCRVESVVSGVPPLQLMMQHIPRAFLLNWCTMIRENKYKAIGWRDVNEIQKEFYQLYEFLKQRDTVAVLGKALLDAEDHVRGFILLEYTYQPNEADFEFAKTIIVEKAIKVAEQLLILDKEQEKCHNYINLIEKDKEG